MSGFSAPQPDIAVHLGIDPKTLRKHFREELDRGSIEATTKVAQSLFQMATSGNNVAAAIFWMKARAGWREKHDLQHSGEVAVIHVVTGVRRATDGPETIEAETERWSPGGLLDQSANND